MRYPCRWCSIGHYKHTEIFIDRINADVRYFSICKVGVVATAVCTTNQRIYRWLNSIHKCTMFFIMTYIWNVIYIFRLNSLTNIYKLQLLNVPSYSVLSQHQIRQEQSQCCANPTYNILWTKIIFQHYHLFLA